MAVTWVGAGASSAKSAGAVLVPTVPAQVVAGDTLLAYVALYQDVTVGAVAGWTLLGQANASVSDKGLAVFTRTAASGDAGATVAIPTYGSFGAVNAIVHAYRGSTSLQSGFQNTGAQSAQPPVVGAGDAVVGAVVDSFGSAPTPAAGSNSRSFVSSGSPTVAFAVADWLPSGSRNAGPAFTSGDFIRGAATVVLSGNRPPNAPTLTSPANNATLDRGITQRFAWTFSDPDAGDSQSAFDLQYRVVGTTPWTTVSATTPNAFYDFAASTFAAGNYEWQVRTYDSQGVVGPWCSSSFFTAATAPPTPTITAPINGATVPNTATLTWSAPNQTDYQWRRVADNAGAANTSVVYADSGDVVDATTRSVTVPFDTNNRYEHIQVRIKNAGLWSSWADIRVQVSYTPPTVAAFTMTGDPATATRTLAITNPAPGAGVPAVAYNDVYCRTAAASVVLDTYRPYSATGVRIGTQLATNTAFVDRAPAGSPVVYEYRVVSVALNQTTSDSGWQATA